MSQARISKLVLATGNAGKVRELSALLAPLQIEVVAQSDLGVTEVPETGTTFVENAIIKARNAAQQTGLPAIADDSGLVVDALDGAPGIYSARYAGADANDGQNITKLLQELSGSKQRSAHFTCTLVLMRHADDPVPMIAQGNWHGEITATVSGSGGFGYDPVFYVESHQCTAAELDKTEKNRISHRGQALSSMLDQLRGHIA